jgi:hypothetical protein
MRSTSLKAASALEGYKVQDLPSAPDLNPILVLRSAASGERFATCPDLLVENPKAEIGRPAAQERT